MGRPSRPTHFVAAALPNRAASEQAIDAVVATGIAPSQVAILHGEVGADAIAEGRRDSRSWFDLSDEERYLERYERLARSGAWVIGVALSDGMPETRARVRSVLVASGGRWIVSRTRWTHEVET